MTQLYSWLTLLLSTQAPALPPTWAMRLDVILGWALVLALLGAALAWRLALPARRLLAASLAVWTFLPGTLSPDYWLGLAFHGPSLSAMLLCAWWLWRLLFPSARSRSAGMDSVWLGVAVLMGYVLLLDTFAVLPLELYGWGFSPALLLSLLALCLLPWVLRGNAKISVRSVSPELWIAPLALLLFAATRLPTGNVWDALLDPWLWLVLHIALLRRLFRSLR